jgi:hypothetical protein
VGGPDHGHILDGVSRTGKTWPVGVLVGEHGLPKHQGAPARPKTVTRWRPGIGARYARAVGARGSPCRRLRHDEQLWALHQAFSGRFGRAMDAQVVGEPLSLLAVDYDGNARRGLTARCRREDGSEYRVALADRPDQAVGWRINPGSGSWSRCERGRGAFRRGLARRTYGRRGGRQSVSSTCPRPRRGRRVGACHRCPG